LREVSAEEDGAEKVTEKEKNRNRWSKGRAVKGCTAFKRDDSTGKKDGA
jgi:hypothetical protein